MAYRKRRVSELRGGVERALAALELAPDAPAHDGWLDAPALTRALHSSGPVLLRAGGELGGAEEGYGALPAEPVWLRVDRGDALTLARDGAATDRARKVTLSCDTVPCCDQPKCAEHKRVGRLCIDTEASGALCIAEGIEDGALPALGAALAARLGVALEAAGSWPAPEAADGDEPLPAAELARWALRHEGEVFVLRDHASRGPREAARLELGAALAMFLGGLAALAVAVMAFAHEASYQRMTIAGAIGVVLTLAAWATLHIGLHSARYRGSSEALLYAGGDRLVVAPWHSRSGAVDVKPEGRYGAALKLSEVEGLEVVSERDGFTLRAQSAHGAYDIGTLETRGQAEAWRRALTTLTARAAHVALGLLLVACTPAAPPGASGPPAPANPPPARPAPETFGPITVIEDDVPRALAEAKKSDKAVFVEVWAPWCHTCLSMKSYVLPDPAIAPLARRVVFAAIDGDRPENADFMAQHAVNVWPTLFVLDGRDGSVLGLWLGAASVGELRDFITSSVDAHDAKHDPDGPLAALLAAKRAQAKGDFAGAGAHYERALARGGAGWARRSETLAGLVFTLYKRQAWAECVELGSEHVASIEGAAVPADFAGMLLACADKVADLELRQLGRKRAIMRLARHTAEPPPESSVDDRSDALQIYAGALKSVGNDVGATEALRRQVALLEEAAAKAPGPKEAATFDYARMMAYLALGEGDKAVVLLAQRAKELPDSYEPRARLAQALMELKRYAEAKEPLAAAIALAYGPRQLQYMWRQATLYQKLADPSGERAALEALLGAYAKLSAAQRDEARNKDLRDNAQKRLAELDAPAKKPS